jgi:hypothetical protein
MAKYEDEVEGLVITVQVRIAPPPLPKPTPPANRSAPCTAAPQNLTFDVTDKKKTVRLLDGVTGFVHPRELVALMGPSGCGESAAVPPLGMQRGRAGAPHLAAPASPARTHTLHTLRAANPHAGKTTMLDVMAGRKTRGRVGGAVRFGGRRATPAFLKRYTGYVEQFGGRSLSRAHARRPPPPCTSLSCAPLCRSATSA